MNEWEWMVYSCLFWGRPSFLPAIMAWPVFRMSKYVCIERLKAEMLSQTSETVGPGFFKKFSVVDQMQMWLENCWNMHYVLLQSILLLLSQASSNHRGRVVWDAGRCINESLMASAVAETGTGEHLEGIRSKTTPIFINNQRLIRRRHLLRPFSHSLIVFVSVCLPQMLIAWGGKHGSQVGKTVSQAWISICSSPLPRRHLHQMTLTELRRAH